MSPKPPEIALPKSLEVEWRDEVALLRIARPEKRNALNDPTVLGIDTFFSSIPEHVKAVVIEAKGENFSAGLDLSEITDRDAVGGVVHSMMWHTAFAKIEFGRVPVVSVLKGAVVGGGLELASATHIRIAEKSAYYALPEGQRGIFVGGGGSVRVPRLIGVHRMADMMLTGRLYDAEAGHVMGISHYLVENGQGLSKALEIAGKIVSNAPITNFAVIHALPRIAQANPREGFLMESMMAAIAETSDDAKERLRAFLEKRAKKVTEF
jgi:(methylthio)acryloyl-CoA hydratase